MPTYRTYSVQQDDHIRKPPQAIVAEDDARALAEAEWLLDGQGCIEVWELARFVGKLGPGGKGEAA